MSDLISREDLKRIMYHEVFETDSDLQKWDSGCWIRYKLFENVIDTIPSAEKVGEWIIDIRGNWACNICGNDPYHSNMKNMNYCPNCGARMERRTDERINE